MAKLLLVDDDKGLCDYLQEWLKEAQYVVDAVYTGQDCLDWFASVKYDMIILDWELPDIQGIDVLSNLRAAGANIPVLMLTGRSEIKDKTSGLDAGADDYLTKPFHKDELISRVRALLRRPDVLQHRVLKVGPLVLDTVTYHVSRAGKQIKLARLEFALLEFFMRHPGEVFSSETLLDRVWPTDSERSPETFRTVIKKLRTKIDSASDSDSVSEKSLITNVYGVGYKLEAN